MCLRMILSSKGHKGCVSEHVPHPLQQHSDNCPTEEVRSGEPRRLSCSGLILSRQLVRAKSSAHTEDERKVLCESLNSSASNSQHSLTGLPSCAFPASPPRASPMVPRQPDMRVRATAPFQSCFHPCFFPSHILTPCCLLFPLSNALLLQLMPSYWSDCAPPPVSPALGFLHDKVHKNCSTQLPFPVLTL